MEIIKGDIKAEIKKIVENRAKYQKVLVVFDDFVSNLEINQIYNGIKEICIFNKHHIARLTEQEINDGYKMIIFVCCVDSFLQSSVNCSELICVFCPKDEGFLPYYLNSNNMMLDNESYIINGNPILDVGAVGSVCVNKFIHMFEGVLNNSMNSYFFCPQNNVLQEFPSWLKDIDKESVFYDIEIIKRSNLEYRSILLVDLILIDGLFVLFNSIRNNDYSMVDVYKIAKEDEILINKFFTLSSNQSFANLIVLNFKYLSSFCDQAKRKVLECINFFRYTKQDVENAMQSVKDVLKNSNNVLSYLYFYNIFGV